MLDLLKKTETYKILNHRKNNMNHANLVVFDDEGSMPFFLKELAKLFFTEDKRIADLIDKKAFSDCVFLPENGKFTVNDAEKISEEATLQAVEGKVKLFVVFDFSDANPQAQNKLLKILEEPPEGVYFLFGATNPFSILDTVLSRMEVFYIQPFSVGDLTEYIERNFANAENPSFFAAESGGYPGKIANLIQGGDFTSLREGVFALLSANSSTLPKTVFSIGEPSDKREFLSLASAAVRDMLFLKKANVSEKDAPKILFLPSEYKREKALSERFSVPELFLLSSCLTEGERDLKFNANFPMLLENCFCGVIGKK